MISPSEKTGSSDPADHLGFAFRLSRQFAILDGVPTEDSDAYADACVGLCQARRSFDPSRGFQFITFAASCARMAMRNGYRARGRGWRRGDKSIAVGQTVSDFGTVADESQSVEEQLDRSEQIEKLRASIDQLPERLQQVILARMRGDLLREIADQLGCTKQRVSQMELQAHAMLREMLE